MSDKQGIELVREVLDTAGVGYEVVEHDAVYSAADEATAAGQEPQVTAKTLAVIDHERVWLAVVPATRRLDLDRARRALRADSHLRLATEEELAREFPSFDVGALPPFGPASVPEVIDIRLLYHDRVLCAGGDHRHGVLVDPRDILRLAEPRVADVCEHVAGEHRFADLPHV